MLTLSRFLFLRPLHRPASCFGLFLLASGCGDTTGDLAVRLQSEVVISEGLQAGDGEEDIRDGWNVDFEKYLAVIGPVELAFSTDPDDEAIDEGVFAVDLTQVPDNGWELWKFSALRSGRWDFGFDLSGGAHDAERHESVSKSDFERLVDEDLTYWVKGVLTKSGGVSCPPRSLASPGDREPTSDEGADGEPCYRNETIEFEFAVRAETAYSKCQIDGIPGVAVTQNGSTTAAITIHGDHLFFNGFPVGSEGAVRRRAQWLADSDLNLDGTVTSDELEEIPWAALSDAADYSLSGSPIPVETALDFVVAELKTQGHYEGEGECNLDGEAHEH